MKKTDKRSMWDEFSLIIRGYAIMVKILGKLPFVLDAFSNMFVVVSSYVSVYFAAQIVNGLVAGKDKESLWRLVAITIGINLVCMSVRAVTARISNARKAEVWTRVQWIFADKAMRFDLQTAESNTVKALYNQIKQAQNWGGWGLMKLYNYYNNILSHVLTIICSASLCVSLFTLKVPQSSASMQILNSPLFVVLFLVFIAVMTWAIPKCNVKSSQAWQRAAEGKMQLINRVAMFLGVVYCL